MLGNIRTDRDGLDVEKRIDGPMMETFSYTPAWDPNVFLRTDFLLNSTDAWDQDSAERFNLPLLNQSFRESVPVLEFLDWSILDVRRGYAETKLPLNANSSNQYVTHQAALQLLAADYTGGLALASLFHMGRVIGFWESKDDKGIYMWGGKATIKWHAPSCHDLICRATVAESRWSDYARRLQNHQRVAPTVQIDMFNGNTRVAEAQFTYWAQDIESLRKDAYDPVKISFLYQHKTKTTAKLIAGLRALEQKKPESQRLFHDPYAAILAGKHGLTLASRFEVIIPEIQRMVAARTKHLDETVLEFVRKHPRSNIVNIGSGYDARFWRLNVGDANVFEMDLPVMLAERRSIFAYDKRPSMHCVPVDLRASSIADTLAQHPSFNPLVATLVIWEGGSMYFDTQDAKSIFSALAQIMAGCADSRIWLDYVTEKVVKSTTGVAEIENFIKSMRKMGEPFVGGIDDIAPFAAEHMLRVVDHVSCADYLGVNDKVDHHYRFCTLSAKRASHGYD